MIELLLLLAKFATVFASALQQKIVHADQYVWVPIPSGIRAVCDAVLWAFAAKAFIQEDYAQFAVYGLVMWFGSTLGTWAGMYVYDRVFRRKEGGE